MASTTRSNHSNRAERRAELADKLLRIVSDLLAEGESFTAISVERLVGEAKMARSTFYVYFEDKGDLVRAWFAQITEQLEDAAEAWWKLGPDSTRDDLREALGEIVMTYRPHTTLMSTVYDAAFYDASVRDEVANMMDRNTASLRAHMKTGQKQGWIDPDLPVAETAWWLTRMAERGQHQMVRSADDAEVQRLIDAYTNVVWYTLYAHAPARKSAGKRARAKPARSSR